jgi:predicted nuclease of predicted toxin-antitoxin system
MRLLLDESVNWRLLRYLLGHDTQSTKQMGWDGKQNGELLELARNEFDALITRDQGIPREQDLTGADVAVLVLHPRSNSIGDLESLASGILEAVDSTPRGQVEHIYPPIRSL